MSIPVKRADTALVAAASAAPVVHEHFTESSSEIVYDFCDAITARIDEHLTGMFLLNERGPDGLLYGQATIAGRCRSPMWPTTGRTPW